MDHGPWTMDGGLLAHGGARRHAVSICFLALAVLALPAAAQKPEDAFKVEAKEYLGTPQSEAAVQNGLEFLAKKQLPDGHWNSGTYNADAAISGLATLAFLSAGHQPGRGKYGA